MDSTTGSTGELGKGFLDVPLGIKMGLVHGT
jgi:hypothetical protein